MDTMARWKLQVWELATRPTTSTKILSAMGRLIYDDDSMK